MPAVASELAAAMPPEKRSGKISRVLLS